MPIGQDRTRRGQTANSHRGNPPVAGVSYDAADLVCVVELGGAVLLAVVWIEWVDLCKHAHGGVVKEAAYDGGALDKPIDMVSKTNGWQTREGKRRGLTICWETMTWSMASASTHTTASTSGSCGSKRHTVP